MDSLDNNILNKEQTNLLKDNAKRAKIAGYIFLTIAFFSVITAISNWFELDLLTRIKEAGNYTEQEASTNDLRQGGMGIITLLLTIASIVTFLNWFRRAYGNLERSGVKNTMHEEKNVGYSFVIPFVSLYRPFQIMKEIDEKTEKRIQQLTPDYEISSSSVLIIFWWTFFLITNVINQFVFRMTLKSETIDQMITASQVSILSDALTIPAAIATYFLIKNIAKKEVALFDAVHKENLKTIYSSPKE